MRIAILAGFPPHVFPGLESLRPRGTYQTWLPQLAQNWSNQGDFQIDWISVSSDVGGYEKISSYSQTFHFVPVPRRWRTLNGYRHDVSAIDRVLQAVNPDLIHAWGTETCYGLAAMRSKRPFVLSMQGIILYLVSHTGMHPRWYLQAFYEWLVLRRAKNVTTESEWGKEIVNRLAPRAKVWRIEYGVNPVFYETTWSPSPKPVAIFVGVTLRRKGLHDAVAAFRNELLSQCELWVVGDVYSLGLQKRSPANVKWLGQQPAEETAKLMSRAWCLVLPTRGDTSPNVVKEARVIGLPVITTRFGGQRDYIEHARNGFIVEPGDISDLAAKLSILLGNLQTAQTMGSYRHEEHRRFFHPQNTASSFLALYHELLGSSHGVANKT